MPELSAAEWDAFTARHPEAHLLQTSAWGALKSGFGWQPAWIITEKTGDSGDACAGVQVLFRRLPLGLSVAYIPKGPVGDPANWERLWPEVDRLCRSRRAVFLKVEPDELEMPGNAQANADRPTPEQAGCDTPPGFHDSEEDIQPARTLVVDLTGTEEQVLARMKQKTRYNIRLALKKEIVVRTTADLEIFHRMMVTTGRRDGFGVHSLAYYQRAYDLFHGRGECELLVAEYQRQPVAAVMVFARGKRAWYFYGASTDEHRERMPTYLLQWEGMRWARSLGCTSYDLWGVPDADEAALEAGFTERTGGLWGVYRFKRGFGGQLERSCGPWDKIYNPALYLFYRLWIRYRPQGA